MQTALSDSVDVYFISNSFSINFAYEASAKVYLLRKSLNYEHFLTASKPFLEV